MTAEDEGEEMMHPFCSVNVNARLMNNSLSPPPFSQIKLESLKRGRGKSRSGYNVISVTNAVRSK